MLDYFYLASRFLAKHTSEDNASFAELLAAMNKRRCAAADARNPPHLQVRSTASMTIPSLFSSYPQPGL